MRLVVFAKETLELPLIVFKIECVEILLPDWENFAFAEVDLLVPVDFDVLCRLLRDVEVDDLVQALERGLELERVDRVESAG